MNHDASQRPPADRSYARRRGDRRIRSSVGALGATIAVLAMALPGSPAHADQPIEIDVPYEFADVNPCTGEPDVFHLDTTIRLHPGHPENLVETQDRHSGWTDSGFELVQGRSTFVLTGSILRVTLMDLWEHPETGERLLARFTVVEDLRSAETRVDSFVTVRCLGDDKYISEPGPS